METLIPMLTVLALIGSLLISGVFFAFSSFIMRALARGPAPEGIRAMQAINIVVINPTFLGVFMGTAGLGILLCGLMVFGMEVPGAGWVLAGGLTYVLGTFGVTVAGNVPLNNALAEVIPESPEGDSIWVRYLERWTRLNTIRTGAALAAGVFFLVALLAP
jgi:uncharacterized membrane protein